MLQNLMVIPYLHHPSMVKVDVALGAAFLAFIGLSMLVGQIRRNCARDIMRPEVFLKELHAEDDADEIVVEDAPSVSVPAVSSPIWTRLNVSIAVTCVVIMAAGCWFGIREYIILQCWYRGESSMAAKDYGTAETLYRKAIRIDPDVGKSHLLLAHALLSQQKTLNAIPELHLAAKEERNDPAVHLLFGDTLMSLNKPNAAEPMYRQAVDIAPRLSTCYVKLGRCLLGQNRVDDAVKEFKYALQLNPQDAKAHVSLGGVLLDRGITEEGLAHLTRAVELEPRDLSTRNALAMGYANAHKYAKAAAEFRVELTMDPDFAIAYFNLGSALEELHDNGGAIGAYRSYLRICGNTPGANIGVPRAFEAIQRLMLQKQPAKSRKP